MKQNHYKIVTQAAIKIIFCENIPRASPIHDSQNSLHFYVAVLAIKYDFLVKQCNNRATVAYDNGRYSAGCDPQLLNTDTMKDAPADRLLNDLATLITRCDGLSGQGSIATGFLAPANRTSESIFDHETRRVHVHLNSSHLLTFLIWLGNC